MTALPHEALEALAATEAAPTKPPVFLPSGNPLRILSACRDVAIKADWSLAKWSEFRESFRRCFSPDAQVGEHEKAMAIVEQHFTAKRGARFSTDPSQWRTTHQEIDTDD